jgi:50S ribosomal protein L16 3-hydroxylase
MKKRFLGQLPIHTFLKEYWQKKPILIRNAFPDVSTIIDKKTLFSLALDENIQSRLIEYKNKQWELSSGPFQTKQLKKLHGQWTLLVQDVNHHIQAAQKLLMQFNFIPYARLDDLMVSYATDQGGVGPHYDSYDVFLLQGIGKRLWQIAPLTDKKLIADAPLKILKKFKPNQEWLLEPGDMLYLPPNYAHNGIATGECMTYSVGFRAPTHQELIKEFLLHLHDNIEVNGMYTDPELTSTQQPAELSAQMLKKISNILTKIQYTDADIKNFAGIYLSKPKPYTFFDSPELELTKSEFIRAANKIGIILDLKTQMLFMNNHIYINGETYAIPKQDKSNLHTFANERSCTQITKLSAASKELLYKWYLNGYLHLAS